MSLTIVIRHAVFSYWNRNARTRTQRIHLGEILIFASGVHKCILKI